MLKLIYSNRYQNQIYTKYNIKFPEEDYFLVDNNIFCIADGVTRDLIGGEIRPYPKNEDEAIYIAKHYPNPSGAYMSSKIIVEKFIEYLSQNKSNNNEKNIYEAIKEANKDVWKINKNRKIDYIGEDLYCSVATGGIIEEKQLYCFSIGDCYIKVFDNDYKEIFTTVHDHFFMEEYEEKFLKKGLYSWDDPRSRILIRAGLRNNSIISYDGKKVGYGALTGEDSAMDFIKTYKVPLEKAKYICAYSDGCIPYFETHEEAKKTIINPERIADDGSERTLIIFKEEE